jgi:AbiJ N-terminal domain 5
MSTYHVGMNLTPEQQARIMPLQAAIVEGFTKDNWLQLGLLTGFYERIRSHSRLLRSLSFGDPDYAGHVLDIILDMAASDPNNIATIEDYIETSAAGIPVFQPDGRKRIAITPRVFEIPPEVPLPRLVAVMMPFEARFAGVHEAIKAACANAGMECERADNVWEHSVIIQDVFRLIWKSAIVVCDFSGRNPNVFYECGIAHTLGKHVIPLAQHESDVPFDLRHHRYLPYQPNGEGLAALRDELSKRLRTLSAQN